MNLHVQLGLGIAAAITLLGLAISFLRKSAALKGYEDYQADISRIVSTLKAELFRDGDDVVITGNFKQNPVQIRFSYSENTPGLNLRMQAPVSFTLSVVPRGENSTEGRVPIRTGDDMFDARFNARTDHPTQAKMLIGSKAMRTHMEKLCCSSKTYLTMTKGTMEVSELVIPPSTARHVLDHIDSMGVLARMVESIPGAESIKIKPYEREKSAPVFRIALAVGAICALLAVFILKPTQAQPSLGDMGSSNTFAPGVDAVDALLIPDVKTWRAATSADFDAGVSGSLRGSEEPSGHLTVEFDGAGERPDAAYWLLDTKGRSRIVMLRNGANVYDTLYGSIAGVARVSRDSIGSVEWKQRPSAPPDGDGIMLVMRAENGYNAVIVYPGGTRIYSGVPEQFENVSVR
jgi:hypothetical protein